MRRQSELMAVSVENIATFDIDLLQAYKFEGSVTVLSVVIEQTNNADAEWNIELDGNDLFATEQSVTAADTPEEFVPEQNQDAHDDTAVRLTLDISTDAGDPNDELNVSVLWDDGR